MGYPPSFTTDAQLGCSAMACRSAAIPFGLRESISSALVRFEVVCTRARLGGEAKLAQRAKAGYCPRCTRPTHIGAPGRYAVGEFPKERARCLLLCTERSPRAARRFAARVYAQFWGYRAQNWYWAAQSLKMAAPPLLGDLTGAVRANSPPYPMPPTSAEDGSHSRVAMSSEKRCAPAGPQFIGSSTTLRPSGLIPLA